MSYRILSGHARARPRHRVMMLKRQMYGRSNPGLLHRCVPSPTNQPGRTTESVSESVVSAEIMQGPGGVADALTVINS
jgi:hypothetical protein